jgi:D-alanine-D-alanine ligase
MSTLRRVTVLYNTDYDAELTAASGADVSAVQASALAVRDALRANGLDAELIGMAGLDVFEVFGRLVDDRPDLVFNLAESMAGDSRNEVAVPPLFELFKLPYTGSDALALGSCLHKDRAKDLLRARGVPTPPARVLGALDLEDPALDRLDYPWFLKLLHEDASVGIEAENLVTDRAALVRRARALIAEFRQPVLAERYIAGREVNVTLIGNGADLAVLPLHEIDFAAMPAGRPHIVSYAAKWDETHVDYAGTKPVPLRGLAPAVVARIEEVARAAWQALGLRDYGRVDLRVDRDGQPWVIDVNPNCDISPDAGVARSAASAGMDYPALIRRIAETAWTRAVAPGAAARRSA